MLRLNLVSGIADRELDRIRRTIDVFENASGLDDVVSTLQAHSKLGTRSEIIDMIGHSRSSGFLAIGTWTIDDSPQTAASFSELIRPSLIPVGARVIRLLGCKTAMTERGCNAIRLVARATRCAVYGTKRYVGCRDYGRDGFTADDALDDGRVIRARTEIQGRST